MSPSLPHYKKLDAALNQLVSSLQLLDDGGAPADIAAHVDLAVCRLRSALEKLEFDGSEPAQRKAGE